MGAFDFLIFENTSSILFRYIWILGTMFLFSVCILSDPIKFNLKLALHHLIIFTIVSLRVKRKLQNRFYSCLWCFSLPNGAVGGSRRSALGTCPCRSTRNPGDQPQWTACARNLRSCSDWCKRGNVETQSVIKRQIRNKLILPRFFVSLHTKRVIVILFSRSYFQLH